MRHRGKRNVYIGSLCLLVVSCLVSSFLFKPPVKIRAEELNQYVYARNNPATYTDPGGNITIVPAAVIALVFVVGGMVLTVKVRGDYLMSKEGKELLDSANQVIYKGKTYLAKQFKKLVTWTGKAVKKGIKALDKAVASVISWIKKQIGKEKGEEKTKEKKKGKEKKKDKGESGSKSIEDILEGAEETTNNAGVARNFEKSGGFEKTLEDFNSLNLSNVKDIQTQYGPGKVGTLSDGTSVVARPGSRTGGATLEIKISNSKIYKIRY